MNPGPSFKRVVIDLHRTPDDGAIAAASELAGWLQVELFGRFVIDPGLARLAALPFAREFRTGGPGWRVLDEAGIAADMDFAAAAAQRLFQRTAAAASVPHRFELVRHEAPDEAPPQDDILVLRYAEHPGEGFASALQAALRSARAVLILPRRQVKQRGPVLVLAHRRDDPAVEIAEQLAAASGEVYLFTDCQGDVCDPVLAAGARLVIVSRPAFGAAAALALAQRRQVPVLVVGE